MTKVKTIYVCDHCGSEALKWSGKCPNCGAWNSYKEMRSRNLGIPGKESEEPAIAKSLNEIILKEEERIKSGIEEFDRTLGGGIVPGSVILLGGDPGVGKSTLILQVAEKVESSLYVSGEESVYQIKMRAERLGFRNSRLALLETTDVERIIDFARNEKPKLLIIDSIQTMHDPGIETSAGSITQVKTTGLKLQAFAKASQIPIILIGHITKSGAVAGPKTLEHLVDVVLYLEGDKYHGQRVLRARKNRFGSTGETGIFSITAGGMKEVKNPSEIFLGERTAKSGSAVAVTLEGSKAILFEVQSICPKSIYGYPKRTGSGIDLSRVQLLSAVVTESTSTNLQVRDVYVNIVGGIKIKEPAIDLAVCAAMISGAKKQEIPKEMVFIGEVGLTGEIRTVTEIEKRIKEAKRLGFKQVVIPRTLKMFKSNDLKIITISNLREIQTKILK